ncbi:hypothetical protein CEUSTIGMA_g9851.t1 [Chlamydomonas eustigma]|uniref:Uncharacterized protein n=1 Tax=Chlamydomonas eustigma TaxID=1157962 RepID=A0A250XHA1_9CHLO|nr:hypothetical protein CEUSTIGMA_g9851.t1 [Chlamydomonas eustigma]|eukprot:GAX82423.1 hypothetical protein CEUSTIGMA_g9851.t1 [Chlamydomonas eustigma]
MERPASRGILSSGIGKAPTGSSIPAPDRPSTANRGGSIVSGPPPGTAMRGASNQPPPGTAYKRLGTANQRPGTGSQGNAAGAAGRTGTSVQVDARPITQHGVSGMKTGVAGSGGRKVLDKNYFLAELRQKRSDIANVTQLMREEQEAAMKKQGQYNTMEKRGAELSKEVKTLQESLADFNTVLDKVGSQTPIYAINAEHNALKDRNEQQRRRVDEILTKRLQIEKRAKDAEDRIREVQQSMEARLNSMSVSQRQQYQELMVEQASLQQENKRLEEALDELNRTVDSLEGELRRSPLKQRSLLLQEQIRTLTEKKYELQAEEEKSKLSPEEQRENLLAKMKRDNLEVENITQQIREVQDTIKKNDARISSMQGGNGVQLNAAEEAAKREKFDELVAKERDLNNFMDSFPSRRAEKLKETQDKQDAIVSLLEKITKLQGLVGSALPTQKKFKEMQDELEYKKMQLENTQMTQDRLKEELQMRRTELEKIDTLDDKIKTELSQLAEKSEQLRANIDSFSKVGDLREKAEDTRARLDKMKASLLKRKDLLKVMVAEKALKHQAKKAQLQENNLQISLEKMEQKLRQVSQNSYTISEAIKAKESETNYKGLSLSISDFTEELNTLMKTRF